MHASYKSFLHLFILCCFIACKPSGETYEKSALLFEDDGTGHWQEKWMLDGQRAQVVNSKNGMELIAGPEHLNDTCHTVLWTQKSFEGNVCIEYDYTRTDTATRCVNILYFLATGRGDEQYPTDISRWNDKRVVPHMYCYFNNMHSYQLSYAAFGAKSYSGDNDYIRLRRYNPYKVGLAGTEVGKAYYKTGLFQPHVTYHLQVYLYDSNIEFRITNKLKPQEHKVCKWNASSFPPIESGRIGFRHMYTRSARYKNIKVWQLN